MVEIDINQGKQFAESLSKALTERVISILSAQGFTASSRLASLILFLFSIILIFIGMRISQPILKSLIIITSLIILLGLFLPSW